MSILNNPEAKPLSLLEYLNSEFGKDWAYWEPETLNKHIEWDQYDQFAFNKSKVNAIKCILNNDQFWKDWIPFEKIVLALNGVPPDFRNIEEVSPAQMSYAIKCAKDIRRVPGMNTPGKDPSFSEEVATYVATSCYMDGLVFLPDHLSFAQRQLNDITGQKKLAEEIREAYNNPNLEINEESPVLIGAAKAKIIQVYTYSNNEGHTS